MAALGAAIAVGAWAAWRSQRLAQHAELFRHVFNANPTAMALTALGDGRVLEANDSFERLLQYPRAELVGRSFDELGLWIATADRDAVRTGAARDGRVRDRHVLLKRRDGERLHIVLSAE